MSSHMAIQDEGLILSSQWPSWPPSPSVIAGSEGMGVLVVESTGAEESLDAGLLNAADVTTSLPTMPDSLWPAMVQ